MKISIITPTFNSASTLKETLESISRQSYPDKEHIIIDGGSKDATLEMVRDYALGKPWVKIVSEKDRGIYDGMNKGLVLATGDIIHILNSDDFYANANVLDHVANKFKTEPINACYTDMFLVNRNNISIITRHWESGSFDRKNISSGWAPAHPTLFVKKELYQQLGNFSLDFSIASDYDFMLRLMKSPFITLGYIPEVFIHMRDSGNSGNSLKQRIAGWKDLRNSWIKNGQPVPFLFIVRRVVSKVPQYVRGFLGM